MYAVAAFAVDDLDTIIEHMGHDAAQEIIRALGSYINKHFGAVGGFSSRQTINEYATVLPYSEDWFEFKILAGLAQGKPQIEIESVMEFARFNQTPIARFQCERGGKTQ